MKKLFALLAAIAAFFLFSCTPAGSGSSALGGTTWQSEYFWQDQYLRVSFITANSGIVYVMEGGEGTPEEKYNFVYTLAASGTEGSGTMDMNVYSGWNGYTYTSSSSKVPFVFALSGAQLTVMATIRSEQYTYTLHKIY